MKQSRKKLNAWQILVRIVSVVVAAIGVSACVYSLTLQIEEVGTTMSSMVWFSGLAGVVASLGGYAASCNPRQGSSYVIPACVVGAVLAAMFFTFEYENLRSYSVVVCALIALIVEALLLVLYHFILKHKDPNAL